MVCLGHISSNNHVQIRTDVLRGKPSEGVRCGTGLVVAIYSIINEHFNVKQFAVNVVVMVRMLLIEILCYIPLVQYCVLHELFTHHLVKMLYCDVVDLCTQFGMAHCVSVLYEEHKATLNDELAQLPSKASYLYKVNIIMKECARVRKNSSRRGFQERLDAFFDKSFSFPSVAARQTIHVRETTY